MRALSCQLAEVINLRHGWVEIIKKVVNDTILSFIIITLAKRSSFLFTLFIKGQLLCWIQTMFSGKCNFILPSLLIQSAQTQRGSSLTFNWYAYFPLQPFSASEIWCFLLLTSSYHTFLKFSNWPTLLQ